MSVKTEEAPSRLERLQNAAQFMRRFRAAGFHDLLHDAFVSTESPLFFEELAAAARNILKYRYETVTLTNYEAQRVFGKRIAFSQPFDSSSGHMVINLVRSGTRGTSYQVGMDWSPLIKGVEARIVRRDLNRCWGRGAHDTTIRVRTPRPAPGT